MSKRLTSDLGPMYRFWKTPPLRSLDGGRLKSLIINGSKAEGPVLRHGFEFAAEKLEDAFDDKFTREDIAMTYNYASLRTAWAKVQATFDGGYYSLTAPKMIETLKGSYETMYEWIFLRRVIVVSRVTPFGHTYIHAEGTRSDCLRIDHIWLAPSPDRTTNRCEDILTEMANLISNRYQVPVDITPFMSLAKVIRHDSENP